MTEYLPAVQGLKVCNWNLKQRQTTQFTNSGSSQTIDLGPDYWEIEVGFKNMYPSDKRIVTSWIARRQGAAIPFYAYRPDCEYPVSNAGASNVGVTLDSVNLSTERIVLGGMSGQQLGLGDMVSYDADGSTFYVGEVVEVFASAGANSDVRVRPAPVAAAVTPNPRIYRATGLFRLMPQTLKQNEPYDTKYDYSFTAKQADSI